MTENIVDPSALREERLRELAGDIRLDDPGQLDFLMASDSLDVQAAPGSGKTTLTALKLCAMARGWLPANQGVCVLSHTNVAKDQIRQRLERDSHGRLLLRPPHFVGTIQSFVDSFLALPYARSREMGVRFIDDDAYAIEALHRFENWSRYATLRAYLSNRQNGRDLIASATFVLERGELIVQPASAAFPSGPSSKSHKQYVALKRAMADDGYYRFSDMYAFARQLLSEHPDVAPAVAKRFPWVIIDEMQDTNPEQQDLLGALFAADGVVVQRIGDENQRIFGDSTDTGFPSSPLELPVSRRFGAEIAEVVSALTMRRPQQVMGDPDRGTGHRMIIVFDQVTAAEVLPRFAAEAERLLPADARVEPLMAVAARSGDSQAQRFPRTLQSYLGNEVPKPAAGRRSPARTLIEAVRRAQADALEGRQEEAVSIIWGGLAQLADTLGVVSPVGRLTAARLRRMIRTDASPNLEQESRQLVRFLLEETSTASDTDWGKAVDRVGSWSLVQGKAGTTRSAAYCAYAAPDHVEPSGPNESPREASGVSISTIHGVKGETHSGTLMLECLDKSGRYFDVPEALKLITGRATAGELSPSAIAACQLAFVALTRPRSLVALAVLDEHVQPFQDDLVAAGWEIVDVRPSRPASI